MNKEQKKPQDFCQTHPHSFHKNTPKDVYCNHCEQPQSDTDIAEILERFEELKLYNNGGFKTARYCFGHDRFTTIKDFITRECLALKKKWEREKTDNE